ncbi:bifunctional phosphoglucose/phosphomannose isomerase [Candidatus Berkelbacteria bacterium]|nr:bifunctional phosphoglucose/phosphomannose isomerase [Candidatus Berkelbacteria bacterium]
MVNLDDLRLYEKLDGSHIGVDIAALPDHLEAARMAFSPISIPTHYVQCRNILILGMGGSAIGGELAAALAAEHASVPIDVRRDYSVPAYVSKDSLVIAVSYSGDVEETLDGFRAAAARGAKLIVVASGGELSSLARKFKAPIFPIDYGGEPRAAFGYLFCAVALILVKLRLLALGDQELAESIVLLRGFQKKLQPGLKTTENLAKTLARKLVDRIPVILAAGPMAVVSRRWKTQLNENGKSIAFFDPVPEFCHNQIVPFGRAAKQREILFPVFLHSSFAHPRNQLRMTILQKQFVSHHVAFESVMIHPSGTPLSEALQMILLGDYVSYYVAILTGVDPTVISAIDGLKKELEAHPFET